jgi:hypothetical protein
LVQYGVNQDLSRNLKPEPRSGIYDAWAASTNRSKSNPPEVGIDESLPRELTFADVQLISGEGATTELYCTICSSVTIDGSNTSEEFSVAVF